MDFLEVSLCSHEVQGLGHPGWALSPLFCPWGSNPSFFSGQVLVEAAPGRILHPPGALPWRLVHFFFFLGEEKHKKITKPRATTSALTISCRPRRTEPAANTTLRGWDAPGLTPGLPPLFLPLLGGTGRPRGTSWVRGRGWGGQIRCDGAGPAPLPAPGQTITGREDALGPEPAGSTVPASDSFSANFLPPPHTSLFIIVIIIIIIGVGII